MTFISIKMKAYNPENDIDRFYTLRTDQNLFGEYVLTINHGKNGNMGRMRREYFEDQNEMLQEMRSLIKRRLNAKSRLGVDYKIVDIEIERH